MITSQEKADLGLIGLGVMGQNLALNFVDHNFRVTVYNRSSSRTEKFLAEQPGETLLEAAFSIEELLGSLKSPRVILLMIPAGKPVDSVIEQLLPLLEKGDILIDGGNSFYQDTQRRFELLTEEGIHYLGLGVSGGEEGARFGPSLMPGGSQQAWEQTGPMLQAVAAQVDNTPCCQWVGAGGAGHYVKMVHNGIEYGDMQLIAETVQFMRDGYGMTAEQTAGVFKQWNAGRLESYLIEITALILDVKQNGLPLVDQILDSAGQKGTGRWTGIEAMQRGVPLTMIDEAVHARFLSALKDERVAAEKLLSQTRPETQKIDDGILSDMADALYAAKIVSYAQGFMLMSSASEENNWALAFGDIALLWRGGCIIRSRFLNDIKNAYDKNPGLKNLLLDEFFVSAIQQAEAGWRRTVVRAVEVGLPVPSLTSALAFYDGYRRVDGSANIIQAQRDFFGAHTYRRKHDDSGNSYHYDWNGEAGEELIHEG